MEIHMHLWREGFSLNCCMIIFIIVTGCIGHNESDLSSGMAIVQTPVPNSSIVNQNETYWIHIDPVGNRSAGETFFVNGTTNLMVGDEVMVEVYPANFDAKNKLQCEGRELHGGATGTIRITGEPQNGSHAFNFFVDTAHYFDKPWKNQDYTVKVISIVYPVKDQVNFTLVPSILSANVTYTTCG